MNFLVHFFFGHRHPDEYGTYPYNPQSPFKDENTRWKEDPLYRKGIGGFLTTQFWQSPLGCLKRSFLAEYWGS